jgi:outer membrane protein TolC
MLLIEGGASEHRNVLRLGLSLVLILSCLPSAGAAVLGLEEAQSIAIERDPSVREIESKRSAFQELAVAGAQLPDPMLRMGFMSLPTDTFHLGQEPMTQVVVGVSQKFPRGKSRSLRSEQLMEQAAVLDEGVRDQRLIARLRVREHYLEVVKQLHLARINADARKAFSDLVEITEDYYATGQAQQQDVLRASVELARVEDRATRIAQDEDRARAQLAAWIGSAAHREVEEDWPQLPAPASPDLVERELPEHPRIAALQRQILAAETGVELADQRYKPEFGVDLSYGGRGGTNPDGSARTDLFSVMLVMDLPLFHGNRQDRYKAASVARSSAAQFRRDDVLRQMGSELELHAATLNRQSERRRLFEETLLPEAEFNAEAAFEAYQAALKDLTTLMRARITELELRLDYAALRAELLKTQARLLYFEGESG